MLLGIGVAGVMIIVAIGYLWTSRVQGVAGAAADAGMVPPVTHATPVAADAAPAAMVERPDGAPVVVVAPRPTPAPDAAPGDRAPGRLIVSTPEVAWASVFLDGKRIGETPLPAPGYELPAGKHTLKLVCEPEVCPPEGKQKTLAINVPAGSTVEKPVRF